MNTPELFKMTTQSNALIESILTGNLLISDYKLFQLILAKIPLKPHIKFKADGTKVTQWRTNLPVNYLIEITAKEYSSIFDIKLYDCYTKLIHAANRLHSTKVKFQYKTYDDMEHLFKKIRYYKDGTKRIGAIFSDDIIPHLSKLKDNLTTIEIENIKNFKSSYSYRLYSLLKMYFGKFNKRKRRGKLVVTCDLTHLREFFGLDEYNEDGEIIKSKYTTWSDLKIRVINTSIRDINKYSDLNVEFIPPKRGRTKVKSFQLILNSKNIVKTVNPLLSNNEPINKAPKKDIDAFNRNLDAIRNALKK